MKGCFANRTRQVLVSVLLCIGGSFIAVRFALWGIEAIAWAKISSAIFCFLAALFGLGFGALGILIFQHNRHAVLEIGEDEIRIRCGWSREFCLLLDRIWHAELQGAHLGLYTPQKMVWVIGLTNARELWAYLLERIANRPVQIDLAAERQRCQCYHRKYVRLLTLTVIVGFLMPLHVIWCALLTDGKNLKDFTPEQDGIFAAFAAVEVITVFILVLLVCRWNRVSASYRLSQKRILIAAAQEHRSDGLDSYGGVQAVKYFDRGTYRVVIFSPIYGTYFYMLERFDAEALQWRSCYEAAPAFGSLPDLYEDMVCRFSGEVFEED